MSVPGNPISNNLFGFGSFAVTDGLEAAAKEAPHSAAQNRHALLTAQILKGLREISKKVPKSITAQLRSVSEALDERAFCQGLLAVGQALVSDGKLEQAALVYNSLQGIIPEHLSELKAETNKRLAALSNRGDLAYQAPVLLQQLRAGLSDEVGLGGMVAAQLTFGVSRLKIFNLLERVWKASRVERLAVASGVAFGLEGAALVGAGEGLSYALGHEAVEGDLTLRQKFGHAYLMMGSLRGAFGLVGAMVGRHTLAAASPLARMGQIVAPQVGMFGAIAFTHAVAPSLDLGPIQEHLGLASLVTYLHFTAAGLALHAIPGYRALNQKIRVETELAIRGVGRHLAETFRFPNDPTNGSLVLISPNGVKVSTRDLGSLRSQDFFIRADASGNTAASPSKYAAEIARIHHELWLKDHGEIRLGGKTYKGDEIQAVDLKAVQVAIWTNQGPIVVGGNRIDSDLWGPLRPYIANLNNPLEIFKMRELGDAYYRLALSIVLNRPIEKLELPTEATEKLSAAKVEFSGFSDLPFEALENKHQRKKPKPEQGQQQGGGEQQTQQPPPVEPKTRWTISLADVGGIIPPAGGAPLRNQDLTLAVREDRAVGKGSYEKLLSEGKVLGWWHGDQANLLWLVPGKDPLDVFKLLRQRQLWTQWFPGFYLVNSHYGDPAKGEALFEIATRTSLTTIHMLCMHSDNERGMQLRWHSPTEGQTRGIKVKLQDDEREVEDIKGSLTVAPTPSGGGALVHYEVALKLVPKQVAGVVIEEIDLSQDKRVRDQAFLSRGPLVAESLLQVLQNPAWGITDPKELEKHRPSTLKGSIVQRTYDTVFVNLQ